MIVAPTIPATMELGPQEIASTKCRLHRGRVFSGILLPDPRVPARLNRRVLVGPAMHKDISRVSQACAADVFRHGGREDDAISRSGDSTGYGAAETRIAAARGLGPRSPSTDEREPRQ